MDILDTHAYDRRQRRNMSCALFVSLLPFFLSTALYFYLWTPDSPPSIVAAGVKSAPTLLLAAVVLSWNGGQSVLMAAGLLFSAVGDCCLIWPELSKHGINAFTVAYVLYLVSFNFSRYPSHPSYAVNFTLIYLYPVLKQTHRYDILIPTVIVYSSLTLLTAALDIRNNHLAAVLINFSFSASFTMPLLLSFRAMPEWQHERHIFMVMYYMVQLLIAVTDVMTIQNKDMLPKWSQLVKMKSGGAGEELGGAAAPPIIVIAPAQHMVRSTSRSRRSG